LNLDEHRKQIDKLDNQILDLLNERMEYVKKIGRIKSTDKTTIYRPERETTIIDRLQRISREKQGLLNRAAIEAIFLEIFAISRNIELPEKISYLGPEGSFSHQAAESRFGAMSEYLPLSTIHAVFEAVHAERAKFGVVPLENNQEGVVNETIDNLGEYDLNIVAEIPLSITFAFATALDRVDMIRRIYSKDIAFRQCKNFIDNTFAEQKIELIPANSTSKAVKLAMEDSGGAAICSVIAAKTYGLPVLFHNIEDSQDNFTRFLIIGKDIRNQKGPMDKTSILTRLEDEPGALVNFLQDFYHAKINLTKIESRPAKAGKQFKYFFYIDFDGHIDDVNVREIINKYKHTTKWLGSYVKMC
jgi:chorismate mutase / prephenate dehydratase